MFLYILKFIYSNSLDALENWDVSNVTTLRSMFSECPNLTNVDSINNWDINRNIEFYQMFYNSSSHPDIIKVAGTWNTQGTFIPD